MKLPTAAALILSLTSTCLPTATNIWSTPCYAADADSPDVLTVTASGTGTDEDKALRQALKNAVMQAVGTIVDAETILKNDDIIKDQVLTASNAIVTKVERIGKPRVEDGLVTVQIRAVVEKRGLMARLTETKVIATSAKVDGKVEFAKMVANLENEKDVSKVIEKCLEGFPVNVMKAEIVGKPEIAGKRGDKVVLRYTVEYSLDREKYAEWRKAVEPIFAKISKPKKIKLNGDPDAHNNAADLRERRGISIKSDIFSLPNNTNNLPATGILVYVPEAERLDFYELPLGATKGIYAASLQTVITHTELHSKNTLVHEGHHCFLAKDGLFFYPLLPPGGAYEIVGSLKEGFASMSLKNYGKNGKESLEKMLSKVESKSSDIDVIDQIKKRSGWLWHDFLLAGLMGSPSDFGNRRLFEKVKIQRELEISEELAKENFELKEVITLHSPHTREEDEAITEAIPPIRAK